MPKEVRHTKPTRHAHNEMVARVREGLLDNLVVSECPDGYLKIKNLYWDPVSKEIVVQIEDE